MLISPSAPNGQNGSAASRSPLAARRPTTSATSQLAQLHADESLIQHRKFNVARFGAGWLRPPGVTKTLQSKLEEAQEQMEQAEMARRDAEMRAQEQAAQEAAGGGLGFDSTGAPDQEERDLDDDVPEAEPSTIASDDEDPENTGNVTFNEESILQGSPTGTRQAELEMEDAELEGRLQDERDLGMEGDMDDDVPEAGSYEHTDSELEDVSSDEEEVSLQEPRSQTRSSARSAARTRTSLQSEVSELLSSSFVDNSPAVLRRGGRANNARGRSS